MDKRTREALEGSIKKWEGIVAGTERDQGAMNCPLCQLFNNHASDPMCVGCPVFDATGRTGCDGTPFDDFVGDDGYARSEPDIAIAQAEMDFLISLRPPEGVE